MAEQQYTTAYKPISTIDITQIGSFILSQLKYILAIYEAHFCKPLGKS